MCAVTPALPKEHMLKFLFSHTGDPCLAGSCQALSLEMIQLKESSPDFLIIPFQNLEIIATLGVGGFGRVEP